MKIRKKAKDLKSGDIVFDRNGERIGIVTEDAVRMGWSNTLVEYVVMNDDAVKTRRAVAIYEYDVQAWQPSQAV